MKKIYTLLFVLTFTLCVSAQDASISTLFGVDLDFYAQQFDGQKYLIMKFSPTKNCIPLSQTSIKIEFCDGTVCKWDGYSVMAWEKSDYSAYHSSYVTIASEKKETISAYRFDMTDKDIELFKEGVRKISIYTVPKVFRKEYTVDKIGMKLYTAFLKAAEEF